MINGNYHLIRVETSTTTQNPNVDNCDEKPVRIIIGLAGIVHASRLYKQANIQEVEEESAMLTQAYFRKVVDDVGKDDNFKRESWVNAVEFMNANGGIVSMQTHDTITTVAVEYHPTN
nr:hypothetical protein [Tanacetum cinerariifolium]